MQARHLEGFALGCSTNTTSDCPTRSSRSTVPFFSHLFSVGVRPSDCPTRSSRSTVLASDLYGWEAVWLSNKKFKVYNGIVLACLLYGCEAGTLYFLHIKQLEHFHNSAFHSILDIYWQGKLPYLDILDRAETKSIEAITFLKAQLCWTRHVLGIEELRMPRFLLFLELVSSKWSQRCLRKWLKDSLKENLKWCDMKAVQLKSAAWEWSS